MAIYIMLAFYTIHNFLILIFGHFLPISILINGAIFLIANFLTLAIFCIFLIFANESLTSSLSSML